MLKTMLIATGQRILWLTAISTLLAPIKGQAQESTAALESKNIDMSIEQLTQLKVFSASRESTSLSEAPSVVTVFTAEQIKQQGLITLNEVLKRTPGFYTLPNAPSYLVANRGILQDQNVNYLLLIDGHIQNNITAYGFFNQIMYPFLSNVERIEIIRGPGSTLWGSDALSGIIHIITKDAADTTDGSVAGARLISSVDFDLPERRRMVNLQYLNDFGADRDLSFSYTASDSNGVAHPITGVANNHVPEQPVPLTLDPFHIYPLSYDAQLKARWGDVSLLARVTAQDAYRGGIVLLPLQANNHRMYKQRSLEVAYKKNISSLINLESRIFYDSINLIDDQKSYDYMDELIHERGFGAEVLNRSEMQDIKLLSGVRYVKRTMPAGWGAYNGQPREAYAHAAGTDVTTAIFFDASYLYSNALKLDAGVRYDKNSLRDLQAAVLPRMAALYHPSESWFFKYMYNTGIMRPTMVYGFNEQANFAPFNGGILYGANVSQRSRTHDLQWGLTGDVLTLTATLYLMRIDNFITFSLNPLPGGPDYTRYVNMAPIHSRGVEFDVTYKPSQLLNFYGNLSTSAARFSSGEVHSRNGQFLTNDQADVMLSDGRLAGVPQIIANAGVNLQMTPALSLNLHISGWADAKVRWNAGSSATRDLGPQVFADANLYCRRCWPGKIDLAAYVKNLNNNMAPSPGAQNNVFLNYGRVFGVSASYHF